jgi:hypothetical protein
MRFKSSFPDCADTFQNLTQFEIYAMVASLLGCSASRHRGTAFVAFRDDSAANSIRHAGYVNVI